MAGRVKCAASRITTKYPKAIYTHCASHRSLRSEMLQHQ